MNITLIRSNKRKNSTTYNSAEYLISKLKNVDKVYQGVWGYFWDNMPDKFKNSLLKKLDKTARKINKTSEKVTMSLKVKMLYMMFSKLHLKRKMTNVDDEYWIKNYKTEG